jgi:hypothetical protein
MASSIQRMEDRKRLRTTSPTGWDSKKPVEEGRSDPRLEKLLSLDCKDGNAGVCIVLPPSARLRVGLAGFAQPSLEGVTLWLIWVRNGIFPHYGRRLIVFGNDTNWRMA